MGIEADSLLIAESTGEGILLRPAVALPVELYSEEVPRLHELAGRHGQGYTLTLLCG
jgi:hypothetical protein